MNLTVLASGSTGNGYLLSNGKETLIIEAGCPLMEVKKILNFNISKVVGVCISHAHLWLDHSKYLKDFAQAGINVYALREVFESKKGLAFSSRCIPILPGRGYKIGNFKVLAFEAKHDVPTVGYLINHPESGNILFLTDSFMVEHTFKNLNHIMLEINYDDEILEKNVMDGKLPPWMRPRLLTTHMELNTALDILRANDLTNVRNIVLCHLSAGNSNEEVFIQAVRETTGKQVYAADKGMIIDFSKEPY